jgi:hypothetical protein
MMKETNDILAEQLAVLSADIKPKVGKTARERAEGIASGHIRSEKTRLEAAFAAWCAQGLLSKMAPEDAKVWHDYNAAMDAMIERAKRVGPKQEYNNNARRLSGERASFAKFLTGEDSYYNADPKLLVMAEKVPGYAKKKAALDKRFAELDAIMAATKKAIWRTHRERGELTVSGIDIGTTVAAIIKQAIGVPALAAPAIVPEVMPAEA